MEVKGISPEAIASAAREVFGNERYISGNVLISAPNEFQLLAQANDRGPWMTTAREISLNGLKMASCELAEDILGATNKNVLAAAWLRRRQYNRVIKLYGDPPPDWDDPDALNNLGVALRDTSGRRDDAVRRFQQALHLRTCYHHLGDPFARFSHYLQSKCFPEGHYNLGRALLEKSQFGEAIAEYQEALRLKPDYVLVHTNLGNAFEATHQYDKAVAEYRKAVEGGDETGMVNLGFMYREGHGVGQDYQQAVDWYRKAADAGDAQGMTNLGFMYDWGYGVAQDYQQAVAWYRKGAGAGDPYGMNDLGTCYESGQGVEKDQQQAITWYRKAAQLGNDPAKENLKRLGESP